MKKDREQIKKIIDAPYLIPITIMNKLEGYIEKVRSEAIGCTHGACCIELDKGNDPRHIECSSFYGEILDSLKDDVAINKDK